jgi:hypothetical protein
MIQLIIEKEVSLLSILRTPERERERERERESKVFRWGRGRKWHEANVQNGK